jgi:hypothetical protein
MTNGETMTIENNLIGHGLGVEGLNHDDSFAEEAVLEHEEEKLMEEGHHSDDEDDEMMAVALANSVAETTITQEEKHKEENKSVDEAQQRYSLRKRRRPTGESSEKPESLHTSKQKQTIATTNAPSAKPPEVKPAVQVDNKQPDKPIGGPSPTSPRPKAKGAPSSTQMKTEVVPAVTVAVKASPLPVPIPAPSLPVASALPPALQPPSRQNVANPQPPRPSTTIAAASRRQPKEQPKGLVPVARIPIPSEPLAPDTANIGVPNPLSNPIPSSSSVAVSASNNAQPSLQKFRAGTKLTVPCPLPPSTFESNVEQQHAPPPEPALTTEHEAPASAHPEPFEKKRVTIDPEVSIAPGVPSHRGRIFSIDMDRTFSFLFHLPRTRKVCLLTEFYL